VASVKQEVFLPVVEVRNMREFDLPVVVSIERNAYQFPWSDGIFRDCLRVGYICRVLDVGGIVAGYTIMSTGAGEAHLLNVCVSDEYRCRGLGRKLMLYMLECARGAAVREIFLEVRPTNVIAVRLYHSMGFAQIGIRRGYYHAAVGREDAIVLRRVL